MSHNDIYDAAETHPRYVHLAPVFRKWLRNSYYIMNLKFCGSWERGVPYRILRNDYIMVGMTHIEIIREINSHRGYGSTKRQVLGIVHCTINYVIQ